jgi:hypothetical protein
MTEREVWIFHGTRRSNEMTKKKGDTGKPALS